MKARVQAPREKTALRRKLVAVEEPVAIEEPVKTKKPDVAEKPVVAEKRKLGDTVRPLLLKQAMQRGPLCIVSNRANSKCRTRLQHRREPRSGKSLLIR